MRRWAALVVLAAGALAGCSAAPAASPAASAPPPVSAPRPGTQVQAQAIAQHLLASLVLPAGATPLAGPVPAALSQEGDGPAVAGQAASARQVYTIPGSMAVAFAYLKAHVPAGIGSVGSGQTTGRGTVEADEITG